MARIYLCDMMKNECATDQGRGTLACECPSPAVVPEFMARQGKRVDRMRGDTSPFCAARAAARRQEECMAYLVRNNQLMGRLEVCGVRVY